MLYKVDRYLLYEILYYLTNTEIFKIMSLDRHMISMINDKNFRKKIIHRKHPIVINILDNFCRKCNFFLFKKYHLFINPMIHTRCQHF